MGKEAVFRDRFYMDKLQRAPEGKDILQCHLPRWYLNVTKKEDEDFSYAVVGL
jgi:hypothetical protein